MEQICLLLFDIQMYQVTEYAVMRSREGLGSLILSLTDHLPA